MILVVLLPKRMGTIRFGRTTSRVHNSSGFPAQFGSTPVAVLGRPTGRMPEKTAACSPETPLWVSETLDRVENALCNALCLEVVAAEAG